MTLKVRVWIAGVTVVAMAGLIYISSTSHAAAGDDMKATVQKIAGLLKKGDKDGAKAAAEAAAKKIDEASDFMHMFRPRNKGGIGWGSKAGANPAKDGLEVMIRDLARDVPAGFGKMSDAGEESGYWTAALGELAMAKDWMKYSGKKTKKAWMDFSKEMRDAGIAFAKASAGKGGQEVKAAAAKLNGTCTNCHSLFKE